MLKVSATALTTVRSRKLMELKTRLLGFKTASVHRALMEHRPLLISPFFASRCILPSRTVVCRTGCFLLLRKAWQRSTVWRSFLPCRVHMNFFIRQSGEGLGPDQEARARILELHDAAVLTISWRDRHSIALRISVGRFVVGLEFLAWFVWISKAD